MTFIKLTNPTGSQAKVNFEKVISVSVVKTKVTGAPEGEYTFLKIGPNPDQNLIVKETPEEIEKIYGARNTGKLWG